MDYKLLKERIKSSRITFRECASFVGLTEAGPRQSIEGERITVSVFEKLCKLLGDTPLLYLDPIGYNVTGNQNLIGGNGNHLIIHKGARSVPNHRWGNLPYRRFAERLGKETFRLLENIGYSAGTYIQQSIISSCRKILRQVKTRKAGD